MAIKKEVEIVADSTKAVQAINDATTALDNLDAKADKVGKSVDGAGKSFDDLGKNAVDAGEAGSGAVAVLDEATGGMATRVKNVAQGLTAMGKNAVASFRAGIAGASGLKKALISTGIGALVVALGTIVAYWDEIVGAVSGVSASQKQLLADTEAEITARQNALTITESSENSLKLQGKTEREIRDIKIQQTNEVIAATELQLEQQKQMKIAQLEAAERNQKIAAGVIAFLTAPITILLGAVDALTYGLKQVGILEEATSLAEDYLMGTASLIFDPEEVAEEGDATIAETEKTLRELKNKRDGYELQNQQEEDQAAKDAAAKREEEDKKRLEEEKRKAEELAALKAEIRNAEANTEAEQRAKALEDMDNYYNDLIAKAEKNGLDTTELYKSQEEALQQLKDKYAEEDKARAKEKRDAEIEAMYATAEATANTLGALSSLAGQETAAGKALSAAQAIINTYTGATKALAQGGIAGPIAAAGVIATGLSSIRSIYATKVPTSGTSGVSIGGRQVGGSSGAAYTSALPNIPRPQGLNANIGFNTSGADLGNQIAQSLQGQPMRAYVVNQDIQSTQKLDRKIEETATFG